MVTRMQFYIDGAWVDPVVKKSTPVVNPATVRPLCPSACGPPVGAACAGAAAISHPDKASRPRRMESRRRRSVTVAIITRLWHFHGLP